MAKRAKWDVTVFVFGKVMREWKGVGTKRKESILKRYEGAGQCWVSAKLVELPHPEPPAAG